MSDPTPPRSDKEKLRAIAEEAHRYQHAIPYWTCAYLNRGVEGCDPSGSCSFSCTSEPECITNGPWSDEEQDAYYEAHNNWDDAPLSVCELLDEVDALRARVAELEEALRPFAALPVGSHDWTAYTHDGQQIVRVRSADVRAARSALEGEK